MGSPTPPADYDVAASPEPEFRRAPERGRVLCFAPHPDDEVIGPGGALCLHRRQGDPVRVIVATDGTAGDPDRRFDPSTYRERRRAESRAGLAWLDVADVAFWGLPDNCVVRSEDIAGVTERAVAELVSFAPEVVYLPWEGEAHSDHRALHLTVVRSLARVGFTGHAFGYEVWTPMVPDRILDIRDVAEQKRRAIACYASQIAYVDYDHTIFGLHAHRSLQFNRGRGYCEGYRRVC
jgi:LmbE family N-acetylglucosaminyl deacetylase